MTVRCVIVDDSREVLRGASRLLEGEGVAVVGVAQTGAEACSLVAELHPDVVLVDVALGAESGFDLVLDLANVAGALHRPAILMSTRDEEDLADLIAASPAIGFLRKSNLSADAIRRLLGEASTR